MSTTSFQDVLEQLRQGMLDAYSLDENGEPQDLTEEQQAEIEDIAARVIEEAKANFEPYCSELVNRLKKQEAEIAELKMRLSQAQAQGGGAVSSGTVSAPTGVSDGIPIPSVEWVASNRKSGKSTPVTGYNVWTSAYCSTLKQGRPPKGLWDKINKKPWDDLATLYNQTYSTGKPARKAAGAAAGQPVSSLVVQVASNSAPMSAGAGAGARGSAGPVIKAGTTAYMLWRDEYYAKNGHLPQKGTWNAQPQHVLDEYKARIKAAHAEIA